ncbi:hypothetical protein YC2023_034062 [Brassica napus]
MFTGSTPGGGELLIYVTHTDMSLCFKTHLNTWKEGLSAGCTSPWKLVWASPGVWDTPRSLSPEDKKGWEMQKE